VRVVPWFFGCHNTLVEDVLGFGFSTAIAINKGNKKGTLPKEADRTYVPKSQRTRVGRHMREMLRESRLYKVLVRGMVLAGSVIENIIHHIAESKVTRRRNGSAKCNKRSARAQAVRLRCKRLGYILVARTINRCSGCRDIMISKCNVSRACTTTTSVQGRSALRSKSNLHENSTRNEYAVWDTDSYEVKVDSGCSISYPE
jgi:hypothetical protein